MPLSSAQVVGTLGVALNQVFIWPQVRRALSTVQGVAALSVLGGLLARITWTVYGARLGDTALVLGNITVATGFLVLLVVLLRRTGRRLPLLVGAGAVVALAAAGSQFDDAALGWLAVVAAAVVNLPQMLRALADRDRLAGVSVLSYLLVAAASLCWLTYGILVAEPLITAPHLLLLPCALVTAFVAARSARQVRTGDLEASPVR